MANCRKCGAAAITRRKAGFFICQRCGVAPGTLSMDRFGNYLAVVAPPVSTAISYHILPRTPRLKGVS